MAITIYGVTDDGYVLKTQEIINTETETALLDVVDPVTGDTLQVDFDSSDIVAQTILVPLEGVGDGLQENQVCYNQFNPSLATGAACARSAIATTSCSPLTRSSRLSVAWATGLDPSATTSAPTSSRWRKGCPRRMPRSAGSSRPTG